MHDVFHLGVGKLVGAGLFYGLAKEVKVDGKGLAELEDVEP
jgi:hypothetical protein